MKIGFKHRVPTKPLRIGFKYKVAEEPAKVGFRRRSAPGPNRMSLPLWTEIVDREHRRLNTALNADKEYFDGSTAFRAVPPTVIPSLLETMGFKEDVCAQEYCDCMDAYAQGRFIGHGSYNAYKAARSHIGRIGSIPYSWKTWRD